VAHGAHPDVSLVPAVQTECAHVPLPELLELVVLELVVLDVLEVLVLLVEALVVLLLVVELVVEVLLPVVELVELVLLVEVLLELARLPPQGLMMGMQTRACLPSVVLIGVQAWVGGHASPPVQSCAQ